MDIFSAGALMYTLLFGIAPWSDQKMEGCSLSELKETRKIPVRKICTNQKIQLTRCQVDILSKMLAPDLDERYKKIEEVIYALSDSLKHDDEQVDEQVEREVLVSQEDVSHQVEVEVEDEQSDDLPKGFSAVAGLDIVKELSPVVLNDDINFDELARITEGYVASDIELIVNKGALASAKRDLSISQELLEERISKIRKSVSESDRQSYDAMYRQMESSPKQQERRIGFVAIYIPSIYDVSEDNELDVLRSVNECNSCMKLSKLFVADNEVCVDMRHLQREMMILRR